MKREMAEAAARDLRKDNRVESAEVDTNEKGIFVRAEATDRMAKRDLKGDLSDYPVYVKVV